MKRALFRSSAQWLGRRGGRRPPRSICPFLQDQSLQTPLQTVLSWRGYADASLASRRPELIEEEGDGSSHYDPLLPTNSQLENLPSPHPSSAISSAKLAALHARLGLPSRFPFEALARCLVDVSADPNPAFNNSALSILGDDILGYHTTEHVLCHYPRLPIAVIFAAQYAYVGPRALAAITREWGVEPAAEPGGEVDPGLLQFRRLEPGSSQARNAAASRGTRTGELVEGEHDEAGYGWRRRESEAKGWRRGISSRIVYDDQFGEIRGSPATPKASHMDDSKGATLEDASRNFVRALFGAIYLHCGRLAAKKFFNAHFLSRHLDFAKLFDFHAPTVDLSRLCAREGFEPPVARLISETGRLSRSPVFVVGVYSGKDKLGEGVGASLDEARFKAAAAALKSWYLYSPLDVTVPSETEGAREGTKKWRPNVVDCGEVVI